MYITLLQWDLCFYLTKILPLVDNKCMFVICLKFNFLKDDASSKVQILCFSFIEPIPFLFICHFVYIYMCIETYFTFLLSDMVSVTFGMLLNILT